jgi:broad specificity phosphatase PhoE
MLLDRLSPWLAALAEDAVVVAHGGVARALLHGVASVGTDRAVGEEIHQGRVLLFDGGAAHWV